MYRVAASQAPSKHKYTIKTVVSHAPGEFLAGAAGRSLQVQLVQHRVCKERDTAKRKYMKQQYQRAKQKQWLVSYTPAWSNWRRDLTIQKTDRTLFISQSAALT
jgi:hypothetical protein